MSSFYKSYLRAFEKYSQSLLERIISGNKIARYAIMLHLKANELLDRAKKNKLKELSLLQKSLFETGKIYVRKFSAHSRNGNTDFIGIDNLLRG